MLGPFKPQAESNRHIIALGQYSQQRCLKRSNSFHAAIACQWTEVNRFRHTLMVQQVLTPGQY